MFKQIVIFLSTCLALQSYGTDNGNVTPDNIGQDSKKNVVSLWDNTSVRELGWVDDFVYERIITRAQRKDVVAYTMKMKEDHVKNLKKRHLSSLWPAKDIFDGTCRHLAFTYEAGKEGVLKLYVDGQKLLPGPGLHYYSNAHIPGLFQAKANLRLGGLKGNSDSFQGQLDEIGVWDYALSPQEIRWLAGNSLKNMIK